MRQYSCKNDRLFGEHFAKILYKNVFAVTTLTVGRMQTAMAGMIVTRAVVGLHLAEDGLLARPRIAVWPQWMTAVTIDRIESRFAFVLQTRSFWSNQALRSRWRLSDVPYNSPAGPTIRGHFGRRLSWAIDAVRDQMQVRLRPGSADRS